MNYNLLTSAVMEEVAMNSPLDRLVEVEIIFRPLHELSPAIKLCPQMRSLSLIGTGLRKITYLNTDTIGNTLTSLCVTDCQLTEITKGIFLPQLKQLFLHRNNIKQISNLEGCPKLEELWLCSNQIHKIENLQSLTSLRTLWLQDNKIEHVAGLEFLGHLKQLALANNPLTDFKELRRLSHLPELTELSFKDLNFGSSPIAEAKGYRQFILINLTQVRTLDGLRITDEARLRAQEDYMREIQDFNRRIDLACEASSTQLARLRASNKRHQKTAAEFKAELLHTFHNLEQVVRDGQLQVDEEIERQKEVRRTAASDLMSALADVRGKFQRECASRIDAEEGFMQAEQQQFVLAQQRTAFELQQSQFLTSLTSDPATGQLVYTRMLDSNTPESQLMAAAFQGTARLLRAYQVHHRHEMANFERLQSTIEVPKTKKGVAPLPKSVNVFYGAPEKELREILQHGFHSAFTKASAAKANAAKDTSGDSSAAALPFVFHSSALQAATQWVPMQPKSGADPPRYRAVLGCELLLMPYHTHFGSAPLGTSTADDDAAATSPSPSAVQVQKLVRQLQPSCVSGQAPYGVGDGNFYFVRREDAGAKLAVVHFYVLCEVSEKPSPSAEEMLSISVPPAVHMNQSLTELISTSVSKAEAASSEYEQRVWYGLDRETAHQITDADRKAQEVKKSIQELQKRITAQRLNQESLIRELRGSNKRKTGR